MKIFAIEYKWYFPKNYVLKKGKLSMFFRKEIKRKVEIRMHYSQAEINIPSKITLQSQFFLWFPISLVLLKDFLKYVELIAYQLWNKVRIIKKKENVRNELFI